ncbi:hypothetical protein B0T22DRAFT_445351 [Podospora appendiculata]|uniref:Uncharacterized protein n=1 Tax=Podospora appendiculata TaxID=314037 RepID=A0AAE1C7N7_9PEZI|nr:hypothetical protein B0T22DRAFT_445351 [Podospora appendiculata]
MATTRHRQDLAGDREGWIQDKTAQIHPHYNSSRFQSDRRRIITDLQNVKFEYGGTQLRPIMPSMQAPYQKLQRLLDKKQNIPPWLAETVRLLYKDNQFPDYLVQRLALKGWDAAQVTNPRLSDRKRRLGSAKGLNRADASEMEDGFSSVYDNTTGHNSRQTGSSSSSTSSSSSSQAGAHDPSIAHRLAAIRNDFTTKLHSLEKQLAEAKAKSAQQPQLNSPTNPQAPAPHDKDQVLDGIRYQRAYQRPREPKPHSHTTCKTNWRSRCLSLSTWSEEDDSEREPDRLATLRADLEALRGLRREHARELRRAGNVSQRAVWKGRIQSVEGKIRGVLEEVEELERARQGKVASYQHLIDETVTMEWAS